MVPIVTSALLLSMVTSENNSVVLEVPFKSTAPVVVMLPLSLLIPVPNRVTVVSLDEELPTDWRSIYPEPLLIANEYTPVVSPRVMLPFDELVMVVFACKGLVREVPFKSILPVAVMADGK